MCCWQVLISVLSCHTLQGWAAPCFAQGRIHISFPGVFFAPQLNTMYTGWYLTRWWFLCVNWHLMKRTFVPFGHFVKTKTVVPPILVSRKLRFILRHSRTVYDCIVVTIHIGVHPDTHTIAHVHARLSMRAGPSTHAQFLKSISVCFFLLENSICLFFGSPNSVSQLRQGTAPRNSWCRRDINAKNSELQPDCVLLYIKLFGFEGTWPSLIIQIPR